jgi:hypothetical protein
MTGKKQTKKPRKRVTRAWKKELNDPLPQNRHRDHIITESVGGEVAKFLQRVKGHRIQCWGGVGPTHTFSTDEPWYGRLRDDDAGLVDGKGRRWWVWHHCARCPYDMSYPKVEDAVFGSFHQKQCKGQGLCAKSAGP